MQSRRNLPLALLLLSVLLVYSNSLQNAFHFDDFHTVTDNPAIRSLGNTPHFFTDAKTFSVLPANRTYRPVVSASLALDYALGHGYAPFWFHLSTLFWFLLLVCLLERWAQWVFAHCGAEPVMARWLALSLAAWFGLHPAMAETVNYVIQRGDLYCLLGVVAALVLFTVYPTRRRWGVYLLPFALAMLSKPPAAVFPVLLGMTVFFFETREEEPIATRLRRAAGAAAPATVATCLLLWLQSAMTPKSYAPTTLSAAAYRMTQPYVWLRYGAALFLPLHLNADTDLQPFATPNGRAVVGFVFAAALIGIAVWAARTRRTSPIAYGVLWFLVTQLPTSVYALSEVENDHRMFFSFPGLMLAVVWAGFLLWQRLASRLPAGNPRARLRWGVLAVCALALCGYAYGTWRRNEVWHSEASLWADDVQKSPHNGRGLMNYGLIRMDAGDLRGALSLFKRALVYTPNYPTLEINLGVVNGLLADTGQPDRSVEAEQHFQRAVALAPQDDLPHAFYGRWLLQHGRVPEATQQLETALSLNRQRPMQRDLLLRAYGQAGDRGAAQQLARETLLSIPEDAEALRIVNGGYAAGADERVSTAIQASLAAYQAGRYPEALRAAESAVALDPHSAEGWNNVGAAYGGMHQWPQGIEAERKALALNPQLAIAANNLQWFEREAVSGAHDGRPTASDLINLSLTLNQTGHYAESSAAARRALVLDPQAAEAWNNIAANEEAQGHWDAAIAAAQRALTLRPNFQLARNNLQWSLEQKQHAPQAH